MFIFTARYMTVVCMLLYFELVFLFWEFLSRYEGAVSDFTTANELLLDRNALYTKTGKSFGEFK